MLASVFASAATASAQYGGCVDAYGTSVPTIVEPHLGDAARAKLSAPTEIDVDPVGISRLSYLGGEFTYWHECGHLALRTQN